MTRWRERAGSVTGWLIVLGLLAGVLLIPALCVLGLFVYGNHWDTGHPWLRRSGGSGLLLALAVVTALPTAALVRSYARVWRLRLRGVTGDALVTRIYETPGVEADDPPRLHVVTWIDDRYIDVNVSHRRRPAVGDRIPVRYHPADPTNFHEAHDTAWSVIGRAIFEVVMIAVILSLLALIGLLLWGIVSVWT